MNFHEVANMRVSTTADRLQQLMNERGLRQTDILKLVAPLCSMNNIKLNKNHLSQYISGKAVPRQDKLTILSIALKVSEAWLMGYNVPQHELEADVIQINQSYKGNNECSYQRISEPVKSYYDEQLLSRIDELTTNQKEILLDFIDTNGW